MRTSPRQLTFTLWLGVIFLAAACDHTTPLISCMADSDCPDGQVCKENHRCGPPGGGETDSDAIDQLDAPDLDGCVCLENEGHCQNGAA